MTGVGLPMAVLTAVKTIDGLYLIIVIAEFKHYILLRN
jgi:hypothetical protein